MNKIFQAVLDFFNDTNKKPKKSKAEEIEDNTAEGHTFRISKPFGYYMPDVDAAMKALHKQISDEVREKEGLSSKLQEAQHQILNMQYEMSTMEVPSINDAVGQTIISAAESKLNVKPNDIVKRKRQSQENKPTQAIDDDSITITFD